MLLHGPQDIPLIPSIQRQEISFDQAVLWQVIG